MLGALTIAAAQRLCGDTFMVEEDNGIRKLRMSRAGDFVLIDHPADETGPRSINCYFVDVQDFTAAMLGGKARSSGSTRSASSTRAVEAQRLWLTIGGHMASSSILRYYHEQGLTKRRLTIEDVFFPDLLDT